MCIQFKIKFVLIFIVNSEMENIEICGICSETIDAANLKEHVRDHFCESRVPM